MKPLIQASTLNALMLGNFDQTISVKEFLHHADTGIGTYTGLDGEAIFEDGVAYRATAEGTVSQMKPEDGVAFGTPARHEQLLIGASEQSLLSTAMFLPILCLVSTLWTNSDISWNHTFRKTRTSFI